MVALVDEAARNPKMRRDKHPVRDGLTVAQSPVPGHRLQRVPRCVSVVQDPSSVSLPLVGGYEIGRASCRERVWLKV
jgi:hypothetical protein